METCGPSRAALSVLGSGRTGPTAPSPPPPPSPRSFSPSLWQGFPRPALLRSRRKPHLPAYCAFERLLFGALGSSLFSSDPHPRGQGARPREG